MSLLILSIVLIAILCTKAGRNLLGGLGGALAWIIKWAVVEFIVVIGCISLFFWFCWLAFGFFLQGLGL
jgi:hypothetical protein